MIDLNSPDEILVCPYNNSHCIIRHRMPKHLVKCRKNYAGPRLLACPYNAMHLMQEHELTDHFKECREFQNIEASREIDNPETIA